MECRETPVLYRGRTVSKVYKEPAIYTAVNALLLVIPANLSQSVARTTPVKSFFIQLLSAGRVSLKLKV